MGQLGSLSSFLLTECSNYCTTALISHHSKVVFKILQARLQQYVECEIPDVQADFRKGRGTRDQMPRSAGSSKRQESSRKASTSALLTMSKPLTVWTTTNSGKFLPGEISITSDTQMTSTSWQKAKKN